MRYLKTNTATIVTVGPFLDKTDGVTLETALTITNERISLTVDLNDGSAPTLVLDNVTGATSGTSNDLNYITNCDAGLMQLELAAANVNYLGRAFLTITDAANHCPVFHEFTILPAMVYDSLIAGTDVLQADMTQILGTAVSTPATAGLLDVNAIQLSGDATAANNAESFFDGTGYAGTNNVIPTVTTLTGHTAQTGDAYARLGAPAGASVSADVLQVKNYVDDIGAAGAGLTAIPTVAAVTTVGSVTGAVGSVTGAVGSVTGNVGGNVAGSVASVTGNVGGSVASIAANGITATSIATDAINAAAVKADAVTKIQNGLATPTNITAGTITTVGTTTNLTNLPAAAALEATLTAMKGATFAGATDSLEAIRDRGDAAWGTATGFATPADVYDQAEAVIIASLIDYDAPTNAEMIARTLPAADYVVVGDTLAAVTTVTNLTNAPTNGDLTAMMKTSVTTAATAATPTAAAVTGAVGSVTGAVGSVTGAVGSVTGSVGSVTAPVTAGTVSDKTGYALSSAGVQAIWDALTSALTTVGSVGKRIADNLDATISSRGTSTYAGGDTAGTTTLLGRIIGTLATGTHNPQTGDSFARLGAAGAGLTALGDTRLANLDATVSSRSTYAGGAVASVTGNVGGNVVGSVASVANIAPTGTGFTAIPWNAAWDAEVQSEAQDAITASALATAAALATVAGYVDTEVAAILAAVDTEVAAIATTIGVAGAGLTALATQASVNTIDDFLDTEVAAIKLVTDKIDTALVLDGAVYQLTANALELAPTGGSAPTVVQIRQEMDSNSTQLAAIVADTNELQTNQGNWLTATGFATPTNITAASGVALTGAYDAAKTAATQTSVDDIPTSSEFAMMLAAADDDTLAAIALLNNLSSAQAQSSAAAALAAYDPPTNAEMVARTLAASAYFDPAADTVAHVTLVDTTTTNTDMVAAAPSAATIAAAVEAAILDEGDATALLAAIAAKVEDFLINDGDATATLAAIATAVRSELTTELGRIDVAVSTRNATTPPTVAAIRSEMDTNSTQLAAIVADTNELQTNQGNWLTANTSGLATSAALAVVDGNVDDILVDTGTTLPASIAALPTDADVQTAATAALNAYDPPTNAEMVARTLAAASYFDPAADTVASVTTVATTTNLTNLPAAAALEATAQAILDDTGTTLPGTLVTIAGYVDTEVAAIKAKTDNLPASPAAVGSAMTLTSAYDAAKTAATQTSVNDIPTNAELAVALAAADDATLAAISGLNNLSSAQAQSAAAAALSAYDSPTKAEMDAAFLAQTGADADTLKSLSDQIDSVSLGAAPSAADIRTEIDANSTQLAAIVADTGELQTNQGNWLTADTSGLATSAALATVDGNVDAIKAKTDNLPASPAAVGSAMTLTSAYDAAKTAASQTSVDDLPVDVDTELTANHGAGQWVSLSGGGTIAYPYSVTNNVGNPVSGARIVATTDEDGLNKYSETFTNEFGIAMFHLTPGNWYFWTYYSGYRPPVGERPDHEVVA